MEGAVITLPCASDISPSLLCFLSSTFVSKDDAFRSAELETDLRSGCTNLDAFLSDLGRRLSDSIAFYASHSDQVVSALEVVKSGLRDLRSRVSTPCSDELGRSEQILTEELPQLAKEVAIVKTVRAYAGTALKLDCLIGDVEDAVSSSVTRKLRVDRALAVLLPQAISDHQSLLSSLGWPPALSGSSLSSPTTGSNQAKISNPLFTMDGELKSKYCESFLSLCCLQELQSCRKYQQLEGHNLAVAALRQPLWAIEELVTPISVASQRHFSKWVEKPELIFVRLQNHKGFR